MITFAGLLEAMKATGVPFAAFAWSPGPLDAAAWGVVSIDGGVELTGDDTHAEDGLIGTIDLFTRRLDATDFRAVTEKLIGLDLAWRLNSVQYEDERRLLHYEWVWESAAPAIFE